MVFRRITNAEFASPPGVLCHADGHPMPARGIGFRRMQDIEACQSLMK
jgi:hypothetical protein